MSTTLLQGIDADGNIKAIAVNPDGSLAVSDSSGDGDGTSIAANQLTGIERLIEIRDRLLLPSLYEQVINANDLYKSISYFDEGTPDERIAVITVSSPSLNVEFYDTYIYTGAPGNYRVIVVDRNQGIPG